MPTKADRKVAKGLSVKLMGEDMLQERWEAMFRDHEPMEEDHCYGLPVDSRRRGLVGSFTYAENVRWNKRLLLQLHRAGLLELLDLRFEPGESVDDDPEEIAQVRLKFPPDTPKLGQLITKVRSEERARFDRGFNQLDNLLEGQRCIARVLAELYEIDPSQRVCGGCPVCRSRGRAAEACPPLAVDAGLLGVHKSEAVINWPDPLNPAQRSNFAHHLRLAVLRKNVRRFLAPAEHFEKTLALLPEAMPSNSPERYRLDPFDHTTVIATPPDETLVFLHLGAISPHAFALAHDRRAVHLCTRGTPMLDADGRGVHVHEQCFLYHSPDAWLHAS